MMLTFDILQSRTLVDLLRVRALQNPSRVCCTFLDKNLEKSITYEQLDNQARAIAAVLQSHKINPGDRILLLFSPGLPFIQAFFGCLYAGCIAVPIYPPTQTKLLQKARRIIANSQPRFVIMSKEHQSKFAKEDTTVQFEGVPGLSLDDISPLARDVWQAVHLTGHEIAFLQYTSGSTMHPKGVMVSHRNLMDNLRKINCAFSMNDASIGLSWLPPHHDMGLIGYILTPIYSGIPVYLMSPFSFLQNPLSWLQNITKYKATISGSPNFAYDYCVKRIKEEKKQGLDLSSWVVASNGAEPIRTETMNNFYQAFKEYGFKKEAFYPCYGLAEATLLVTGGSAFKEYKTLTLAKDEYQDHRVHFAEDNSPDSHHLVSCGELIQDLKIVDPDHLTLCDMDQVGEIWIRSPSVTQGYWHQPEETAHSFKATIKGDNSQDMYLRTGDLGFIHEGELYVTGRIKDLIILYGKNHYPQDLEFTLLHSPIHNQLGKCAAIVVQNGHEYNLTVLCEIKNGFITESEQHLLFNSIFEIIYQAHQLEIHTIVLTPLKTLPLTTSGKIRRNFCRKYVMNNTLPVVATWQLSQDEE